MCTELEVHGFTDKLEDDIAFFPGLLSRSISRCVGRENLGAAYPDANLPQIRVLYRWHQQPLRNLVHVASVPLCRWLIPPRDILCNTCKVLVGELPLTPVKPCVVGDAPVHVVQVLAFVARFLQEAVFCRAHSYRRRQRSYATYPSHNPPPPLRPHLRRRRQLPSQGSGLPSTFFGAAGQC